MNKPISLEKVLGACIIVVIVIIGFFIFNNKNKVDQSAGARNAPITNAVQTEVDPTANIDPEVLKQAYALHAEDDTVTVTDKNGAQKVVPVPKKVFLMGGTDSSGTLFSDVYSSADGVNWSLSTNSPGWTGGGRSKHASVYFKGKIWLLGGFSSTLGVMNDVWNTSDGINWTHVDTDISTPLIVDNAPWSPRQGLSAVVFNNKIWITAGSDSNGSFNDMWSTSNGINWNHEDTDWSTPVIDNAPWMPCDEVNLLVYDAYNNGQPPMYAIDSCTNIVWYSPYGNNWSQFNSSFNSPTDVSVIAHNDGNGNKMWIIGNNYGSNIVSNVLNSQYGIVWNSLPVASWDKRQGMSAISFLNKIWIFGGVGFVNGIQTPFNEIYSSTNGMNWNLKSTPSWSPRFWTTVVKVPITFGQKPDLVSWDIQWRDTPNVNLPYSQIPISKSKNNPVSFMITIKNNGTADAILPSNTVMRLYKDSITSANIVGEFNTATTPYTIVAGGAMDFYFNSTKNASNLATLGSHNFILYADKTNKVDELDETNNTLTTSFSMIP